MHDQATLAAPSDQTGHDRTTYRYAVHTNEVRKKGTRGSLVDRGANGGILGSDAKVTVTHQHQVDVTGIDNHELNALKIVDAVAKVDTHRGPVIAVLRQYAYHGIHRTIHSAGQIEYYKNMVDDRSLKVGGRQCIVTNDGYVIPLDIRNGLPYLRMVPPTDAELSTLTHVILTCGERWDPKVLDHRHSDKDDWYNDIKLDSDLPTPTPFDEQGNYRHREPSHAPNVAATAPVETHMETHSMDLRAAFHSVSDLNARYLVFDTEVTDTSSAEVVPEVEVTAKPINYEQYRPFFLHVPVEKIRRTFEGTTQNAQNVMSGHNIMQTIKSPFPAHNVWRRNEPVATDTVEAAVPAICTGGQKFAQIYVGRKSLVIDVFGMVNKAEFVNTLEDIIRRRGAMDKLTSDSADVETSSRVKDILRALCIDDWQSEPHYQHQNFAEHRWKHLKRNHAFWMNHRNVDSGAWLLCLEWVADVMNLTAEKSLGWRVPLEVLTGQTQDISILLVFGFWDVVYVPRYPDRDYSGQPGEQKSSEIRGRFVGFSKHVGHALTFKILTDDTQQIIHRSRVRLAKEGVNNLKLDVEAGAVPERVYIRSKRDALKDDQRLPTIDMNHSPFDIPPDHDPGEIEEDVPDEDVPDSPMDRPLRQQPEVETVDEDEHLADHLKSRRKTGEPNPDAEPLDLKHEFLHTENPTESRRLPPDQMKDRTFLMPPAEDGSRVRAKILDRVDKYKNDAACDPAMIQFRCRVNNDYDEIVHYNDIVDYIEQDGSWDGVWKFEKILNHKGPLTKRKNPDEYMGSMYNVQVEWTTGEITWVPLSTMYRSDPVTVAIYASEKGLLDTTGWKLPGLKKRAKTQKRLIRLANQANLHSFRTKPVYMYGFLVPRNHEQAMEIDARNGNTRWRDAELQELGQIDEYETFINKGRGFNPGPDWKKIRVHLVYCVKHCGRHKARLVAGGHLTDTPIDSVYSSVVSLRGIRLLTFIAELNGCEVWATDIGNAYLESFTKEKVYIVAGPEFGERAGCTLIISKALYGLKSSGLRWHERFADVLRAMGFFPSRAEPDIWMRDKDDHYEYIGVYVDDLLIVSKNPQDIIDQLTKVHSFKLKGTGPIQFHLGCDFFRDEDGVLCYAPRKYIEKVLDNYERIYGCKPRQVTSPLVKGDHPELDTSELLEIDDMKIYQSLIGSLQWTIQIGRFDIATAVMTLSRFRAAPRRGHLDRVKRICGYLSKMRHGIVRIRTDEPDYSDIPKKEYDWEYTCYHGAKEILPTDAPSPKGKRVQLTTYVDANLYHDLISGRSVTGVLHLANKPPIDWYSKLQSTVETATFGSEYVAARTSTEQIIDLRTTFRYLGVPVASETMMFGDNETVVNTASVPHSKLMKRHNALSYHRTREAIAAGILRFHHMPGANNPADILSKHWDYASVWSQLRPLLFWRGDTAAIAEKTQLPKKSSVANEGSANEPFSPTTQRNGDSPKPAHD